MSHTHTLEPGVIVVSNKGWQLWTGRTLSGLLFLVFLASASMKLAAPPQFVAEFVGKLGFPAGALTALAVLEIACVALYAIPRTSVLGAILLTGYLGGTISAHVRIGDAFLVQLVLGIIVWTGLYLRDKNLRHLLPIRG